MDTEQWTNMPDHDKLFTWEKFACGQLTPINDIILKFYWVSRMMRDFLPPYLQRVKNRLLHTNDDRVYHQLILMEQYLQEHKDLCDRVVREHETTMIGQLEKEYDDHSLHFVLLFQCGRKWMHDRNWKCLDRCRHIRILLHGTPWTVHLCIRTYLDIQKLSRNMFSAFLERSVSQLYYVWKIRLFTVSIPFPPSLDDLSTWDVICEDDEVQVLSHPLLPHPADFLHKKKKGTDGERYADKAQFGCYIPGTLTVHNVVFSKKPSIIPQLKRPTYHEETAVCQSTTPIQSPYTNTQSSTTSHKGGKKKRRKTLSRVRKETLKKRKPRHRVWKPHELVPQDDDYDDYDDEIELYWWTDDDLSYYNYDYY